MTKMKFLIIRVSLSVVLLLLPDGLHSKADSEICSQCNFPKIKSYVQQYCVEQNSSKALRLEGSCCINTTAPSKNEQIIGVDLSVCKLKKISGLLNSLHNSKVLLLDGNVDLQIQDTDFSGLPKLHYMSLPKGLPCPGGNSSWNSAEIVNNKRICKDEINLCIQNNVTCANNNSHCVLLGPGQMECLCLPGYYGYKCLRQGTFPTAVYFIVLCVCTVSISGFLWCTTRRKVGKTHKQS